jgi:hypothetical protein
MIKVSITQDGEFRDEIEFDAADIIAYEGALAVVHRDGMQDCARDGLWHRVAHAATVVAERGNLLDALEADGHRRADDKALDVPSDSGDEIEQEPGAGGTAIDDDLYHLERDPDETDEDCRERARMLGCDERGDIRLPRWRPASECLVPCIICGRPLKDESGGNNQPVEGLAFQCEGHWPSAVFDAEPGWLEINICEPCLHNAVERQRVLHGDRPTLPARATYRFWQWPKRS